MDYLFKFIRIIHTMEFTIYNKESYAHFYDNAKEEIHKNVSYTTSDFGDEDNNGKTFSLKLELFSIKYDHEEQDDIRTYFYILSTNQTRVQNMNFPTLATGSHPFERLDKDQILLREDRGELCICDVVAKNEVTNGIFNMIMMNDKELDPKTGMLGAACYRTLLIQILSMMDE